MSFVDELDLVSLGFESATPADTGRPAYHPAILLKIYIYGYLNRIQSSRRLERETQRNVELMWLTGRLMPDFKTIANFRKDNSKAIRGVCRQFVVLCQQLGLFGENLVAIDGSKFKAVNHLLVPFDTMDIQRLTTQQYRHIGSLLTGNSELMHHLQLHILGHAFFPEACAIYAGCLAFKEPTWQLP
jgi:transposase